MPQNFVIEKNINQLVEQQFPEFFRTDGPVFVQFVKEYYKWLEGTSDKSVPVSSIFVNTTAKSNEVDLQLSDSVSNFSDYFSDNDKIAIYEGDGDYRIYEIDTVANNQLILTTTCHFSGNSLAIGTVVNSPNVLYHSRRLFDYDDVDNTVDEYIVYFKEKYLKNIQFETQTNTKQLIKHALDIYRSKGTERAADLLFRLVFGVGTNFYYPSSDVFKLSDGHWYVPTYLELSLNESSDKLINKQIVGLTSGATAFAESLIRKTVKGKLIDVMFISEINGNFQTGEVVNSVDEVINNALAPRITGSLTELEIDTDGVSDSYRIGDIVDIESSHGEQGKARVTSVSDITGLVTFNVPDTGYAYTSNADVYVSEKVLVLSNVVANQVSSFFNLFEKVYQPLANIAYISSNGSFAEGDVIKTYHANNLVDGTGIVFSVSETNSTSGTLLVGYESGNLGTNQIFTDSNAVRANVQTYTDVTATGNVIAFSSNITLTTSNLNGTFIPGEEIYQLTAANVKFNTSFLNAYSTGVGSNGSLKIYDAHNSFLTSNLVYGEDSGATAYVNYVSFNLGVIDVQNSFYATEGNRLYGNTLFTVANVSAIGVGSGATFALSNTLNYSEEVILNTDFLADYLSVPLNATTYGFPGNTQANISWALANTLTVEEMTIGRPTKLVNINRGQGYSLAPMTLVFEPLTYPYLKYETVTLGVDQNAFYVGELVTQDSVDSRGLVIEVDIDNNLIVVENFRFWSNNFFVLSTNSQSYLIGEESGGSANIISITEPTTVTSLDFMGANFIVGSNTQSGNGAITGAKIIDSGFAYVNNEIVTLKKEGYNDGTARSILKTHGKSLGRYKQKGGFLSDQKKLYDGIYYQDFSYEIRSSVPLTKYEDMLKKLLHVSGTKYFGAYVKTSEANVAISSSNSLITVA